MEEGRTSSRRRRRWFWAGVLALLVAAAVTRFYRLGSWPLFGDEYYTLRDSVDVVLSLTTRPLLFWLNHHVVQPFVPLDELGLRLLPALFGVAGVGAVTVLGRRLLDWRAGLLAGGLAVLNPWHLAMSQFARYYTLVFLVAAVTPAALYIGVRERSRGWIALGAVGAVVAWFAHPTAILPTAGFLAWLTGYALVRSEGRRRRLLLVLVAVAAVVALGGAWAVLSLWTSLGQEWGIGGVWLGVSYGVRLAAGPTLAAAAGVVILWLDGRRELATFLAAAGAVPLVLLGVLGEYVSVHTGYLFATAPYALLAAAAFVERATRRVDGRPARLVVAAALVGLVVATGLPSFASHYVDGGKADFRAAARHVAERAGPSDVVVAHQPAPFDYYEPSLSRRSMDEPDPARLDSMYRALSQASPPGDLWIVPYVSSEGGFGLSGLGEAQDWVWRHCRLTLRDNPVRIDHVRNIVEVWRCDGNAGGEAGSGDGADAARASPGEPPRAESAGPGRRVRTSEAGAIGSRGARSGP